MWRNIRRGRALSVNIQTTAATVVVLLSVVLLVQLGTGRLTVRARSTISSSSSSSGSLQAVPLALLTPGARGRLGRANDTSFVSSLNVLLTTISSHAELAGHTTEAFWEGMGMIAQVKQEILDFLSYADDPQLQTLCEVGFNAGHSATVLLAPNSNSVLHVFDMGTLPFAKAQKKLFKRIYGDRITFYKGDSVNLLPWFKRQRNSVRCDLFSVDGDHSFEGSLTDFWNALQLMRVGGRLVADDISPDFEVPKAWEWLRSHGYVKEQHCNAYRMPSGLRKGWCMAEVLKVPSASELPPEGYKQPKDINPEVL